MVVKTVHVLVCDFCGLEPARAYSVKIDQGLPARVDLCASHSRPIDTILAGEVPDKAPRQRRAVVTLEEIEAIKRQSR